MVIQSSGYHTSAEDEAQWANSPGYVGQWPCATEEVGYTTDGELSFSKTEK